MSTGVTRRSFTESLALAALAPAFGLRSGSHAVPWSESLPLAAVEGAEEPGAFARALAAAIRAQYGARLSKADLATITKQIQTGVERAATIRKVELENGDEPHFVFSALAVVEEPSR